MHAKTNPIQSIPSTHDVLESLRRNIEERRLLRRLLKVAKTAESQRTEAK